MTLADPSDIASSPVSRLGLQRKTKWLLQVIAEIATGPLTLKAKGSVRRHFDQAIGDLRWSWEHFRDDPLAQAICWRFPVVLDKVYDELAGGFDGTPIPRSLLIQLCERGIEAAHCVGDARLRDSIESALASRAAALHLEMGDTGKCANLLMLAHSIAEHSHNNKLLGRILSIQAELHLISGERERRSAKDAFIRAVEFGRISGDGPGEAMALFGMGKTCRVLGERLEAAEWLRGALQQAQRLNLIDLTNKVIQELGALWVTVGEFGAAIQSFEDAVTSAADSYSRGQARLALGEAWLATGSLEQAQQCFELAESDAKASGDRITLERVIARRSELGKT